MSNHLQSKITTASFGDVYTWKEVETAAITVWAAESAGSFGPLCRGHGGTEVKAIVDLLQGLAIAREQQPEPIRVTTGSDRPFDLEDFLAPGWSSMPEAAPVTSINRPEYKDLPAVFWSCLREGLKIRAIKHLREATRLSLLSAKQIVDAMMNTEYVND